MIIHSFIHLCHKSLLSTSPVLRDVLGSERTIINRISTASALMSLVF